MNRPLGRSRETFVKVISIVRGVSNRLRFLVRVYFNIIIIIINKAKNKAAAAGECVDFLYFTRSEIRSDIICVLLVNESVIYLFCISVYLFV